MVGLTSGNASATVDPHGAWVQSLTHDNRNIFFPRTAVKYPEGTKQRGGMHVCLPNFGPGGDSGLAQHGFGRTSPWEITETTVKSVVLQLPRQSGEYQNLSAQLRYELSEQAFTATLTCHNSGDKPLRLAPGFHPYFPVLSGETTVKVNRKTYRLDKLSGTEYFESSSATLDTEKQSLTLLQTNLATWALWTDQMAGYVCLEPNFGGNRFLEQPKPGEMLLDGQEFNYSFTVSW